MKPPARYCYRDNIIVPRTRKRCKECGGAVFYQAPTPRHASSEFYADLIRPDQSERVGLGDLPAEPARARFSGTALHGSASRGGQRQLRYAARRQ